jgi:hypothetical protein
MNWKKWANRTVKVLIAAGVTYLLLAIGMALFIILILVSLGS